MPMWCQRHSVTVQKDIPTFLCTVGRNTLSHGGVEKGNGEIMMKYM